MEGTGERTRKYFTKHSFAQMNRNNNNNERAIRDINGDCETGAQEGEFDHL